MGGGGYAASVAVVSKHTNMADKGQFGRLVHVKIIRALHMSITILYFS